ncbi:MAG: DUF4876 domain-containing protein [candidate division KSB1 bacterium]|nr:DUF4876 domain-containing protein [candidate division KSB1 bacterium]
MQNQESKHSLAKEILISLITMLFTSFGFVCSLEKPTAIDGTFAVKIMVLDTTRMSIDPSPVAEAKVQLTCNVYKILAEQYTDSTGKAEFVNLLAGHYQILATKEIRLANNGEDETLLLAGNSEIEISPSESGLIHTVTIGCKMPDNLVINEVYYAGIKYDKQTYCDDQFVELYNPTTETIDLNGYVIARGASNKDYIGTEFVECVYAYQFAGRDNEYLVPPHDFIVIAQDALDHREYASNSIDLSQADYECFSDCDFDNPSVPNLVPINSTSARNDFQIDTLHDIVLLIKPSEKPSINANGYLLFRVADVVDGVKYISQPDNKLIDPRIDRGYAGTDISRFSGRSIERHHPISGGPGYDSNNSSFDFITLIHAMPKRQHFSTEVVIPKR